MVDVQISDRTYELAKQAAKAQRVSLDEFIEKAVQLSLQDEALSLTQDQIATVRAAQEDVKTGRILTTAQAKADLEVHRQEWRAAHKS